MAPVQKLAISMTTLTAIALVMSACAGNLEAKKLGARTGVQGKVDAESQPLLATEVGETTFQEGCDTSDEIKGKLEGETEIKVADLIDGKGNKYVLSRTEIFQSVERKSDGQEFVVYAKSLDNNAEIICQNSKNGSPSVAVQAVSPTEFNSNDGSSAETRISQFLTENAKIGARTFTIEKKRNLSDVADKESLLVTKDSEGNIRFRDSGIIEDEEATIRVTQLTVFKVLTAEQAATTTTTTTLPTQEEPKTAQEAADAVAAEAGIPAEGTTDEEDMEARIAEAQARLNERLKQQSEELARKQTERMQAQQDARNAQTIAEYEASQAATTTSTTLPRRTRAADEIDYTTPGSYPRATN